MKNRVSDDFWKVEKDLPKVDVNIETVSVYSPKMDKVVSDGMPGTCFYSQPEPPLLGTGERRYEIYEPRGYDNFHVRPLDESTVTIKWQHLSGWKPCLWEDAPAYINRCILERIEKSEAPGVPEVPDKPEIHCHSVIFAQLDVVIERIIEGVNRDFGTNMHCSSIHSGKWLFEISTREEPPQKIGDLIVEPFNPPEKDEETGDVYTHMYKWVQSGESACTTDLEVSLRTTLEKRWKRFQYELGKKS